MVNFCKSSKCLVGKTALITGANAGIGYETALEFAKRGCRVILACRSEARANEARENLIKTTGNTNIVVKLIDLESLDSVREFAKDINATEDRLDLLVNNAGAAHLSEKITSDGLQLEMAVNYFSPYLLTNLLLDLMKRSAPSRIVNVASSAALFQCKLDLKDINKFNGDNMLYAKSKLCNIYFTQELAKKLEGTNVTTYSLHPGAVHTEFQRFSSVLNFLAKKCFKTAEEGAQTSIFVSLEDGIEEHSGGHFTDCKYGTPYYNARDPEMAAKLWDLSAEMVGLNQK